MEEEDKDGAVQVLAEWAGVREQLEGAGLWVCPRAGGAPEEEGPQSAVLDIGLQELP